MEEELKRGSVIAEDYINNMRKKTERGMEESINERADVCEFCEDETQNIQEEMLHVTIRHLNNSEITLWTIVSKREWQQAITMREKVTLFEKGTFGQSTEDVIKETEKLCDQRTKYITSEMEKIQQHKSETNLDTQANRYELLHERLGRILKDRKSIIQDYTTHKNRIVAKLEELYNGGLLEFIERPVEDAERMAPWEFIRRKNLLLDLK